MPQVKSNFKMWNRALEIASSLKTLFLEESFQITSDYSMELLLFLTMSHFNN